MSETKNTSIITVVHDKITPKKFRFTGISQDEFISIGVYIAKDMPIHRIPDEIILKMDLSSISKGK